jgi:iron complex outermembrane receptor protein
MPKTPRAAAAALILGLAPGLAAAAPQELSALSLEQLSDIVVTSVSRQEERLSNAAASIFIISSSDIMRSGARSLPEVLRLAPNLQVARVDARNYAITARGFNNPFANKLLVLIDGRSVYSPLFSGVFWDAQDTVMSDIERIEVISGPGATIYGSNAVNGVINVITKSSKDTQGGWSAVWGGSEDRAAVLRYGTRAPGGGHVRAYAKATDIDDTETERGVSTDTGMRRQQAGFRADWDLDRTGLTLSGDAYQGRLGQIGTRDIRISGANLNGAVNATLDGGSELRLQLILDHTERNQPNAFVERLDTVDLQFQHNALLAERHRIAWGAGYRRSADQIDNGPIFAFLPGRLKMHWGNAFLQDEIALVPTVKATLGFKAEHNNYTGFEYLPNLRLAWTPDETKLLWGSLARTVRAPSRIDRDLYAPSNPAVVGGLPQYFLAGGPEFQSEVADVAEIGFRGQPTDDFSWSATAFYSEYERLRTLEPRATGGAVFSNQGLGRTSGIEAWGRWQPVGRWRLSASVVAQRVRTGLTSGSRDQTRATGLATSDPELRWTLRSSHDISDRQILDVSLRYESRLAMPAVPSYYEMDVQWSWRLPRDVDISVLGQNLLHARHAEYGAAPNRSVFPRTVLLKIGKRF